MAQNYVTGYRKKTVFVNMDSPEAVDAILSEKHVIDGKLVNITLVI